MALEMDESDHEALNKYLNDVLDAFKSGKIDKSQAHADLAHATCSAAYDEDFHGYIRQNPLDKWNEQNR